jgi:protein-tyrosine phosphatase
MMNRAYWVIEDKFMAGALPSSVHPIEIKEKINFLLAKGITIFINLMEEGEVGHNGKPLNEYLPILKEESERLNIDTKMIRFPIIDLSIPSKDEMKLILSAIKDYLDSGHKIYVHCWGGVGRTGTVVGCFLMELGLVSTNTVLSKIEELKSQTDIRNRLSPETFEQKNFVINWLKP